MKIVYALLLASCLYACALLRPAAGTDNAAGVRSPELHSLLKPNEADLPYPVYASFDEIEPLFRQNDGITYVINFWASWCRPCIAEMDHLERLAAETDPGEVQIVLVSLDKPAAVRGSMLDFVRDRPLRLPTVAFTDNFYDGWIYKVDEAWQRSSIPVTLVYRNRRRHFNRGQISSYAELRGLLRRVRG